MIRFFNCAALCAALLVFSRFASAQEFEPKGSIELIVMAGKGGGAHLLAEEMVAIAEKKDLFPHPVRIRNLRAGSGAEALQYVLRSDRADHVLLATLNSFYTTPLLQEGLGVDILEFQPIALMGEEGFLLWVHPEDGPKTLEGFKAAALDKGAGWVMAGTGFGSEDEILTKFLNFTFGLRMEYHGLDGGGRVARELAHGRVDSTLSNPSEAMEHFEEGRLWPIAAFSDERLAHLPDVVTLKELGVDFSYAMHRQIVGGPRMSEAARAYYEERFRIIFESDEWREAMEERGLHGAFLSGAALRDRWALVRDRHVHLLRAIDAIK